MKIKGLVKTKEYSDIQNKTYIKTIKNA